MRKTTILMLLGIVILGMCVFASAEVGTRVRANVPFAFYADRDLMPAGEYVFVLGGVGFGSGTGTSVMLQNPDGTVAKVLLSNAGSTKTSSAYVYFNRYGSRYFLSKVEGGGHQANVAPGPAEKEMRAQARSTKELIVASGN